MNKRFPIGIVLLASLQFTMLIIKITGIIDCTWSQTLIPSLGIGCLLLIAALSKLIARFFD